jgi:cyclase
VLKKRIIPLELISNRRLVKGVNFGAYRDVGDPVKSSAVYNSQHADELIVLNIERDKGIQPLLEYIENISEVCFMPLTFGGGISSFADASELIARGADKVCVNSICYTKPQIVSDIRDNFGAQAVVVSIDVRYDNNQYVLYSNAGKDVEKVTLEEHIAHMIEAGAGEILLQSIDRDGTMQGYDVKLAQLAMELTDIPVLIAGGSGDYQQLRSLFEHADVNGVVCGSLFNFSDSNPVRARSYLLNYGLPFKLV